MAGWSALPTSRGGDERVLDLQPVPCLKGTDTLKSFCFFALDVLNKSENLKKTMQGGGHSLALIYHSFLSRVPWKTVWGSRESSDMDILILYIHI